ncbi:MAG: BREX-1 system adenine-specific DNA-methyltransferase PglX [Alphaproteobacteria bacterium]|nr:BREX-1 system adenine-specific DNA-methyltransferase PglX [Alphaproteobacteria bacterium]MBQ3189919.1 BREX-1 system adenine-specific DNA-methyltransferase PglX [Bacteroides sp.]
MATNTSALKTFAQQTRLKLLSLIKTKMEFILTQDTAELRGYETQIVNLKTQIQAKGKDIVVEEAAYTWFNRVMALRYMDANDYSTPKVVTPALGHMRPEILQEAMSGSVDENLRISPEDLNLPEAKLYRKLLVATCNHLGSSMPFLFEHISDYTELLLPEDLLSEQSFVSDIRKGMTDEDCQNVEIMGWLYQFYITDRKADAETKKSKKGGLKSDEQAAATQLFTPHWVVRYMVENSLGRTWMTLHPDSRLKEEMPYYIPIPEGQTDTIPEDIHSVSDIKFIDPCMGSGHVLVYAFDLFCKMYEEEGYQTREIPSLILTNNIYGIDIDPRCKQLAAFALTMKARAYHSRYLRRAVIPNTIALEAIDRDVIASTGAWSSKSTMWQFENVDTIGSLLQIDPKECSKIQVESGLFGSRQQLLKTQAEYLSQKYHCVVTNPPYLGKGFCESLSAFLKKFHPDGKADTMVAFMERCVTFCSDKGKVAMINLPSWMFLSSFENLRTKLIKTCHIDSLLHMGRGIFGVDWGSVAFVYSLNGSKGDGMYFRLHQRNFQHIYFQHIGQLFLKVKNDSTFKYDFTTYRDEDVSNIETFDFKYSEEGLQLFFTADQENFEKIPGCPIGYWVSEKLLNVFSSSNKIKDESLPKFGMSNGDGAQFLRFWPEVSQSQVNTKWFKYDKGGPFRKWYGNRDYYVNWENNGEAIKNNSKSAVRNSDYFFHPHFSWTLVGSGNISLRYFEEGFILDTASNCVYFKNDLIKWELLSYLNSPVAMMILKIINPTINNSCGVVGNIPYIKTNIDNKIIKDNIALSKLDWDAHETSWDFQKNELIRLVNKQTRETDTNNYPIEAVMMVYQVEWADKFKQLHANEEELNRQFIEIYGLQDELTPDVPLDEVTILQKGEISIEDGEIVWHEDIIIKQLISYLVGCFMGRYSIDKPGLIIASQNQDLSALGVKVEGIDNGASGRIEIDDDGVVPILAGEYFPDDMTVRIEQAIKQIFGEEHFQTNLCYIDEKLGKPLREYLFKDFFNDHIDGKMYQKRPIYWMFSSKMGDKRKKGYFKALVYMHRMESDTLSKLHADYVVPYIDKIEQQHIEAEDLSLRDDISQAARNKARKSAEEYAVQIRELKDFEQVLVQMASQRLSIDLDDGVRVNYPKFYPLVEPIKGLDKE